MKVTENSQRQSQPRFRERRLADASSSQPFIGRIPPNLFQTSPSRVVHVNHFRKIAQFRKRNPDLNHIVFDETATDHYMKTNWSHHPIKGIYDAALFGPMKADIFRYCLVFERGGFYLDISKAFSTPISSMVGQNARGFIGYEKMNAAEFPELKVAEQMRFPDCDVIQWCFGFEAGHRLLELAINRVVYASAFFLGREFPSVRQAIFAATGPGIFTWATRQYLREQGSESLSQADQLFGETQHLRISKANHVFRRSTHYASVSNAPIFRLAGKGRAL